MYQNEEGKWVTNLAYYSSFEKELENNPSKELSNQFQNEDFVTGSEFRRLISTIIIFTLIVAVY